MNLTKASFLLKVTLQIILPKNLIKTKILLIDLCFLVEISHKSLILKDFSMFDKYII